MSKKIILIIVALIIIISGVFIFGGFMKNDLPGFTLEKVLRGNIEQEIVETGIIQADKINLGFNNSGQIKMLGIEIGDIVELDQILAKIDDTQLLIQLEEAKIVLELAEIRLSQLMAGASEEEIRLAQTAIDNAEIALLNAKQALEDIKTQSNNNLNQAYEDAFISLNASYIKIFDVFNTVNTIQRIYFNGPDERSIQVRKERDNIENAKNKSWEYIVLAKNRSHENIDIALREKRKYLTIIIDALKIIRDICDEHPFYDWVSVSDKKSLDVERVNINNVLVNITNKQQIISSLKLTSESNINNAQTKINSVKGQLENAENTLAIKKAIPQQTDINLHNAQIRQAEKRVNLIQEQIKDSVLRAPVNGKIAEIFKEKGEIIQRAEPLISLLPITPFQVKVDIYEEDIAKVKIGNSVEINLIAFPEQSLKGKVISINPTEKLIGGVVYYETIITFINKLPEGVRSGMTADIVIQTAFRENVLIISEEAIEQGENNNFIVSVYKDGIITERIIEIGLRDEDGNVEIISGLEEGEQVIIR